MVQLPRFVHLSFPFYFSPVCALSLGVLSPKYPDHGCPANTVNGRTLGGRPFHFAFPPWIVSSGVSIHFLPLSFSHPLPNCGKHRILQQTANTAGLSSLRFLLSIPDTRTEGISIARRRAEIWNFSWSAEIDISHSFVRHRVEHVKTNSISPSNHVLFCLLYKQLTNKKKPTLLTFENRTLCRSFMALNRASDVSAADWRSQTKVKNYRNFSRVEIRFFSVVDIPIKQSSLYNNCC